MSFYIRFCSIYTRYVNMFSKIQKIKLFSMKVTPKNSFKFIAQKIYTLGLKGFSFLVKYESKVFRRSFKHLNNIFEFI